MAERPVFIPAPEAPGFVKEKSLTIAWAGGFAAVQKKKNVKALHNAALAIGLGPILEASTKSDERLGQHLSAFHLKVKSVEGDLPLECAYQGSKVFEEGGPYTDLYFTDARSAKRDPRLQESGRLIAFEFEGHKFPLEPKTVFYDWLYITAIFPHRDWLDRLSRYAGFSDIEFNPQKSINCQARSLALFVSLKKTKLLDKAVQSPECFIEVMQEIRKPGRRSIEAPAKTVREAAPVSVTPAEVPVMPEAVRSGVVSDQPAAPKTTTVPAPELAAEASSQMTPEQDAAEIDQVGVVETASATVAAPEATVTPDREEPAVQIAPQIGQIAPALDEDRPPEREPIAATEPQQVAEVRAASAPTAAGPVKEPSANLEFPFADSTPKRIKVSPPGSG
jgi:hypothetical protein